jgi:hypothetical protein
MRDLIVTDNITLDGVIEATGWFDPVQVTEGLQRGGKEVPQRAAESQHVPVRSQIRL